MLFLAGHMDLKGIITGVAVSIAGLFGCHKAAAPATATKAAAPAAESNVKDLGILQMTNNYETCVSIGKDKDCRMIPKILDHKDIQIMLTFETKKPDGKTTGLSVVQLQGTTDKPFEVSFGDTDFTFTPQIAGQ
jgi:hypothetical protein